MSNSILDGGIMEEAHEDSSAPGKLFGEPLFPFTPQRVAAAVRMGMVWPHVPARDWKVLREGVPPSDDYEAPTPENPAGKGNPGVPPTRIYPQIYEDCVLVCYLCAIPPAAVKKAFMDPEALRDDAFAWADKYKIFPKGKAFDEACEFFGEACAQMDLVEHEAEPQEEDKSPKKALPPNS